MTDLERLGEWLRGEMLDPWADIIDAHLKEDAERELAFVEMLSERDQYKDRNEEQAAELSEGQDRWRRTAELLREKNAELAELREAVREHLYRFHREGGAARLRQLIEEDERGPAATDSAISKARREEKS